MTMAKRSATGEETCYLKLWTCQSIFNEPTCNTSAYTQRDEEAYYFYRVNNVALATRLVRLFEKQFVGFFEDPGTTITLEGKFSCVTGADLDEDDCFLIDEDVARIHDLVEDQYWDWRIDQGLCIRDNVLISGEHLIAAKPPLGDQALQATWLCDQAMRWEDRLQEQASAKVLAEVASRGPALTQGVKETVSATPESEEDVSGSLTGDSTAQRSAPVERDAGQRRAPGGTGESGPMADGGPNEEEARTDEERIVAPAGSESDWSKPMSKAKMMRALIRQR